MTDSNSPIAGTEMASRFNRRSPNGIIRRAYRQPNEWPDNRLNAAFDSTSSTMTPYRSPKRRKRDFAKTRL